MSDDPPPREERPPLSPLATAVAVVGILVALFCGGCTLYALSQASGAAAPMVLVFGGIPTGFGVVIWWIAVKHSRPMKSGKR
jgi:hypothetical protein